MLSRVREWMRVYRPNEHIDHMDKGTSKGLSEWQDELGIELAIPYFLIPQAFNGI